LDEVVGWHTKGMISGYSKCLLELS